MIQKAIVTSQTGRFRIIQIVCICRQQFNSLLKDSIVDWSKLKEFADKKKKSYPIQQNYNNHAKEAF